MEGREKERERNISMWLPLEHPLLGTRPVIQACTLIGNPTSDPLVCRLVLSLLSHTSKVGRLNIFINLKHELQEEGNMKFNFCSEFVNVSLPQSKSNNLMLSFCWIGLAYQRGYICLPFDLLHFQTSSALLISPSLNP